MDIEDWRAKIDEIDEGLLTLLNRRMSFALEIGKIKAENGEPVYSPDREALIRDRIKALNSGPLSDEAVDRLFWLIIGESRSLEQKRGEAEA